MWDLPRPGLEPVSPALAGRFSTTAPPGKPCLSLLNVRIESWSSWRLQNQHGANIQKVFTSCLKAGLERAFTKAALLFYDFSLVQVSLQPASHQSFGCFWVYGIQDSRAQHSRLNFELVAFRTKITWVQGYGHRATVLLKSYFFILSFIEEGMCFFKLLTYFLQKKV